MNRMLPSNRPGCSSTPLCTCIYIVLMVLRTPLPGVAAEPDHVYRDFEVVIAGGSTAALAAAISAAASGARTALIEPTDWIGGQLTASGVPAVDEAWHVLNDPVTQRPLLHVSSIARNPRNISPSFHDLMQSIPTTGECWVSRFCFQPKRFVKDQLEPLRRSYSGNLKVFYETVPERVVTNDSRITAIEAIRRRPRRGVLHRGYDRLLSQDLDDWYSPEPSERFSKEVIRFESLPHEDGQTVFIDATEWGEVLALSGAPYLIGVEHKDGGLDGDDTNGQATVFCFVQAFTRDPGNEKPTECDETMGFGDYSDREDAWQRIWTYRRIRGEGPPSPGDLCLQNWGYSSKRGQGGNDYPFGYLFKTRSASATEVAGWSGGINQDVLAAAEQRALAWHQWFKRNAPEGIDPSKINLHGPALGTGHGLAKLPYIRDTRRSIGLDNFVLTISDLSGPASQITGKPFIDRIALGAYAADIHPLTDREYPDYIHDKHVMLPFFIPFRALTNRRFENLLVSGKTMAQSFLANSATRLHPIEWSTGSAAGVSAAYMARSRKSSRQVLDSIEEIQELVRERTPIEWTIDNKTYPSR